MPCRKIVPRGVAAETLNELKSLMLNVASFLSNLKNSKLNVNIASDGIAQLNRNKDASRTNRSNAKVSAEIKEIDAELYCYRREA